jgi:glutathione S-transferase
MTLPILYSFRRCPYAMRARLAILRGGHCVELREVALSDKPVAMIESSPKGTVPVLVRPEATVIDESLDIMLWAMADIDDAIRPCDTALIAANDGTFKYYLDRYKYADRYDVDRIEHRRAATDILERLVSLLIVREHLGDEIRLITDLAIMPFVRQFAETDRIYFDGLPLVALQGWLMRHLSSELFAKAMVRIKPWRPDDAPVLFQGQSRMCLKEGGNIVERAS